MIGDAYHASETATWSKIKSSFNVEKMFRFLTLKANRVDLSKSMSRHPINTSTIKIPVCSTDRTIQQRMPPSCKVDSLRTLVTMPSQIVLYAVRSSQLELNYFVKYSGIVRLLKPYKK